MLPRVATWSWRTGDRVVAPPANVMSVVPDITAGNGAESDEIFVCRGSVGLSQSEGGEGPYRRWVSGRVSDDLGVGRRSTYTASGRRYGRNPRPNRHPGHFPTRRFISPAIRGGPKRSQKARSKVDYRKNDGGGTPASSWGSSRPRRVLGGFRSGRYDGRPSRSPEPILDWTKAHR